MTDSQLSAPDKVRLLLDVYKVLQGEHHSDLSDSIVAAAIRECDILTASPSDSDRPTGIAGVDLGSLESTKAVPECQSALAAAPDNPCIKFELGRAFVAAHQFVEARRLFEQDADYVPAINSNGYMYLRGLGGPPDYAKAAALFQRAADSADMYGIINLADMYNEGLGIPQNERTACTLYGKAASMGDASAMFSYAVCFALGKLGEPREEEFIKWDEAAMAAGYQDAFLVRLKFCNKSPYRVFFSTAAFEKRSDDDLIRNGRHSIEANQCGYSDLVMRDHPVYYVGFTLIAGTGGQVQSYTWGDGPSVVCLPRLYVGYSAQTIHERIVRSQACGSYEQNYKVSAVNSQILKSYSPEIDLNNLLALQTRQ